MNRTIPSAEEIRARLAKLSGAQITMLSGLSDVPYRSLWKIRKGETKNPGIDTVRKFWPHMKTAKQRAPA